LKLFYEANRVYLFDIAEVFLFLGINSSLVRITGFQHDILKVAGYDYQSRYDLLQFIASELQKVEKEMTHRIQPVRKTLQNKADKILGFVKNLEVELVAYANLLECDVYWLWKLCYAQRYDKHRSVY